MPAEKFFEFFTRSETAGVGNIKPIVTSVAALTIPDAMAVLNISEDNLVSSPIRIGPFPLKVFPTATPIFNASSGVISLFAIPLAPSVPKIFLIA